MEQDQFGGNPSSDISKGNTTESKFDMNLTLGESTTGKSAEAQVINAGKPQNDSIETLQLNETIVHPNQSQEQIVNQASDATFTISSIARTNQSMSLETAEQLPEMEYIKTEHVADTKEEEKKVPRKVTNQNTTSQSKQKRVPAPVPAPAPEYTQPELAMTVTEQQTVNPENTLTSFSPDEESVKRFEILCPYDYQISIFDRVKNYWEKESQDDGRGFGNIVYLETGTGKTYIAVMLLKALFNDKLKQLADMSMSSIGDADGPGESMEGIKTGKATGIDLVPLTDAEMMEKKQRRCDEQIKQSSVGAEHYNEWCNSQKKAVFIIPTQNLVEQQANTIDRYTFLNVGRYHGGQKQGRYYTNIVEWRDEMARQDVLVVMAKKFYDLLMHGFIKIENIDLLIFDECHHTDQDHLYNLIMKDFYFHKFKVPADLMKEFKDDPNRLAAELKLRKRPKVLGLTASPIKQKIDKNRILSDDIETMLQNLANNLYSRFVTISAEEIADLEKDLRIQIKTYNSNFDQNLHTVSEFEEHILKQMAKLIRLPSQCYKTQVYESIRKDGGEVNKIFNDNDIDTQPFVNLIETQAYIEASEEQDTQVVKFLNGRKQLIELDSEFTRNSLDIASFKSYEDQVLIIFCIIMLKNTNNLLIEIGPLAVKAFFLDLKRDLLVTQKSSKLGNKRDKAIEAINHFCNQSVVQSENAMQFRHENISNKVNALVEILNKSLQDDPKLKTIIFVKDRSVAVYLKKILSGSGHNESKEYKDLDESEQLAEQLDESFKEQRNEFRQGLLSREHFRIGFAMGFKSRNLVNKAYRSTNTARVNIFQDVLSQLPSCRSIKLSQNELKETLDKFKQGQLNVLIATNVVEEGLDVSTCNQVICLNELLTVKAFIQMKGRARQENSKFVFLCAKEEEAIVKENQESFASVIGFMKQITTRYQKELLPSEHIVQQKQIDDSYYFEVKDTGAKLSMREAKLLIESFCALFVDREIKLEDSSVNTTANPSQLDMKSNADESRTSTSTENADISSAGAGSAALSSGKSSDKVQQHFAKKPNYLVKETNKDGLKYYYCVLYFPLSCKDIIRKVNPQSVFVKKRDAENHVALLAIKKLKEKGFFDGYLFPVTSDPVFQFARAGKHLQHNSLNQNPHQHLLQSHAHLQNPSQPQQQQPRKQKQISDEVKDAERKKQKQFDQNKKQVEFEHPANRVNLLSYMNKRLDELYVYVFNGKQSHENYPFKNTNDFIGILFDRRFNNDCLEFLMYQEFKQKQKNQEHLNNLMKHDLVTEDQRKGIEQIEECLTITLRKNDAILVKDDLKRQEKTHESQVELGAKLQCYHCWLFYYLYSADYKFLKAILKNKFDFVQILFGNDISRLLRRNIFKSLLKELYGERTLKAAEKASPKQQYGKGKKAKQPKDFPHFYLQAYTVPITSRPKPGQARQNGQAGQQKNQQTQRIDWEQVDRVVESIRDRLYEIILPTERAFVVAKYDLEEVVRRIDKRKFMATRLWDQKFQGNRYVVLSEQQSHKTNEKPIDLNQGRKEKHSEREDFEKSLGDFMRTYWQRENEKDEWRMQLEIEREYEMQQHYEQQEQQYIQTPGIDAMQEDDKLRQMPVPMELSTNSKEFNPASLSSNQPEQQQMSSFKQNSEPFKPSDKSNNTFMINTTTEITTGTFDEPCGGYITPQILQDRQTLAQLTDYKPNYRTREFYFLKQGIFQNQLYNKYIVKCRKERHFIDFGKRKRDEVLLEEQLNNARADAERTGNRQALQKLKNQQPHLANQTPRKKVNTEFDIPDQMLSLSPITYNQYQVLQQTCYHMANFNEFLMIELFINDVFDEKFECLLNPNNMEPSTYSMHILHTIGEIKELGKDDPNLETFLARDILIQKVDVIREALTAPSACREYDYERLEFYGDSIVGFLVILELYVTKPTHVEGDLDFERIRMVSNQRFYEVNRKNEFYNYMITESHHVFSGFIPAGFEHRAPNNELNFQTKVIQKSYNELYNKLQQLKQIKARLSHNVKVDADPLEVMFQRGNIYQLVEMIMKEDNLVRSLLKDDQMPSQDQAYGEEDLTEIFTYKAYQSQENVIDMAKKIFKEEANPREWLLRNCEQVISRVQRQINHLRMQIREPGKKRARGHYTKRRQFYYKQLADVVESVTGAVTLVCGVNFTQDYLRKIGVLKHDQHTLRVEMNKLVKAQEAKSAVLEKEFYNQFEMRKVEKIMNYNFRCKAWLIEALTHKSYQREMEKHNMQLDDYERLEFLGDSVLGCLMAKYFFLTTQFDEQRKMPKELHKMKTSVINNNLLSLIVIENKINEHMIYNKKAAAFRDQFDNYVKTVHAMQERCGTTFELYDQKLREEENAASEMESVSESNETIKNIVQDISGEKKFFSFDLDELHEHNLKIFGDVFESLIGAVFLDSQSIEETWDVLWNLIKPYVKIYADLETLQDHSRTLLLEMWNQKLFTKNLKCLHKTQELEGGERSMLKGIIQIGQREEVVYEETFTKDAKSKVRTFYKRFYQLVKKFIDEVDAEPMDKQNQYYRKPDMVISHLKRIWEKMKKEFEKEQLNITQRANEALQESKETA